MRKLILTIFYQFNFSQSPIGGIQTVLRQLVPILKLGGAGILPLESQAICVILSNQK